MKNRDNKDNQEKNQDIILGEQVINIAKKLGSTTQEVNDLIEKIKQTYTYPFFGKEEFHERLLRNEVGAVEYIGHALNVKGGVYDTFDNWYEKDKGSQMKRLIEAMLLVDKKSNLFLGSEEAKNLKKAANQGLKAYEAKAKEQKEAVQRKIEDEISAHKSFLNNKFSVETVFNDLINIVANEFNIVPDKLSVTEYSKKAVDVKQLPWKEIADSIAEHLSRYSKKNIIVDPHKWPAETQNLFQNELSKQLAAMNLMIVGDSKYVPDNVKYEKNMLGIFKSSEKLRKQFLDTLNVSTNPPFFAKPTSGPLHSIENNIKEKKVPVIKKMK